MIGYIGILGEAAAHVPPEVRAAAPGIPWQEIRGMRNILVHANWRVDADALWRACAESVPRLIPELRRLLATLEPPAAT